MRLIDADKFAEDICNLSAIDEHSANAVIFLLHEQPTVEIKTEVAREIFAEIDKRLDELMIIVSPNDCFITTFRKTMEKVTAEIAELKNKYIKDGAE